MSKKVRKIIVIGSGMGALSTASLLVRDGHEVTVLEQNYLIGGCTSSYWRKGYIFESGATTLVGLQQDQPLHHLLTRLNISLPTRVLNPPMKVYHPQLGAIVRYADPDAWIAECRRVFGEYDFEGFWRKCLQISRNVWQTSTLQRHFPWSKPSDIWYSITHTRFSQIRLIPYAFQNTWELLKSYGLHEHSHFLDFVDQQLIITSQSNVYETNALFGATALSYTLGENYYLQGGMISLAQTLSDYIQSQGGKVHVKEKVLSVTKTSEGYDVISTQNQYQCHAVVSGVPLPNTKEIYPEASIPSTWIMPSENLASAFQVGLGLKYRSASQDCLHHQVILEQPLPFIASKSIFLSYAHPDDTSRADHPGHTVANISTHMPTSVHLSQDQKQHLTTSVLQILYKEGLLMPDQVAYVHASQPKDWMQWTGRWRGFVGGYPQLMNIKPWQMPHARIDHKAAYQVGDTVYPGQGIPGVVLSGIIAYEKFCTDQGLR